MSNNTWVRNLRGEWYVIAQAVLFAALLLAPILDGHIGSRIPFVAGGLLCAIGLGFIVFGTINLGRRNLSPFPKPKENATLVERGIFSIVRHPIYSGFIFFSFGWSLVWQSVAALIAAAVLLVFFDIKARREERWLEAKFNAYAAYKKRVKKLIPLVY